MVIYGDLNEIITDDSIKQPEESNLENIPWEFQEGTKIPPETCSLYSIDTEKVTIDELSTNIFQFIEKSSFSHISAHIYSYDELFVLFFEFAIEKDHNQFEFAHFGIVPASDFFRTLKINSMIKIRDKRFHIKKSALDKISKKVIEFKTKFPDNSLL